VTDVDETADDAYEEIWTALARRFGDLDLRQNMYKR